MSTIANPNPPSRPPSPRNPRFKRNRTRQKVNLKATLDLTSYFDQYKLLTTTAEQNVIDKAVYNDGNPDGQNMVSKNPNLTAEHCLYLIHKIDGDGLLRQDLILNSNFPISKLLDLARNETDDGMLRVLAGHPRATVETKVTAALRIGSEPDQY